tara:strand:- start:35578 stop:36618 length:1041 start_codon:yes stop_codon:yes gene_type:complete
MFKSKYLPGFLITLGVIGIVASSSNFLKKKYETNDNYDLIKDYLLNDSPLYGQNRPKLWIHSKYDMNARKWKNFYSRNSTNLNQDYLHLTIKTIINHCGDDFNICLIDDQSFSKLIPGWDIDLSNVANPVKHYYRNLAMTQLIYTYGGMVVPNSFICLKNLKPFYEECIHNKKPFVTQVINRTSNLQRENLGSYFIPGIDFIGAEKNDPTILELGEYLKKLNIDGHISKEDKFLGLINHKCIEFASQDRLNVIDGKTIGVKSNRNRPILLDDLCEEAYIDLDNSAYGIYIPADEVLSRTKYQWLANISSEALLNSKIIIAKYLKASIMDTTDEYYKNKKEKCVVTI